jgi:hypothetical protein
MGAARQLDGELERAAGGIGAVVTDQGILDHGISFAVIGRRAMPASCLVAASPCRHGAALPASMQLKFAAAAPVFPCITIAKLNGAVPICTPLSRFHAHDLPTPQQTLHCAGTTIPP